jgi:hypothetical protein
MILDNQAPGFASLRNDNSDFDVFLPARPVCQYLDPVHVSRRRLSAMGAFPCFDPCDSDFEPIPPISRGTYSEPIPVFGGGARTAPTSMGTIPVLTSVVNLDKGLSPEILMKAEQPFTIGRFHISRTTLRSVASPSVVQNSL